MGSPAFYHGPPSNLSHREPNRLRTRLWPCDRSFSGFGARSAAPRLHVGAGPLVRDTPCLRCSTGTRGHAAFGRAPNAEQHLSEPLSDISLVLYLRSKTI